ncbi:MAG: tetratricopeptide repeat protein [Planctomycetota bacterium]|jgi:tetratricopeptide (TPR) repeat protein
MWFKATTILAISFFFCGCVTEEVSREATRYYFESSGDLNMRYRRKAAEAEARPHDPGSHWFLGNYHLRRSEKQSIGKARAAFTTLMNMMPDKPHGYYGLGLCDEAEGKPDKAVHRYETAIDKDAGFADSYQALARVYKNKGNSKKAKFFKDKYAGMRMAKDFLRSHHGLPNQPLRLELEPENAPPNPQESEPDEEPAPEEELEIEKPGR